MFQDGAVFNTNYIRNCNNEELIKILPNSSLQLGDNCDIFAYTCVEINPYKTAKVIYLFSI